MEQIVYQGKILRVTEENIHEINWERVYLPDGVIIFPINHEGKVLMVEERRPHENPPIRIKPVSGILEPERGSPEENALIEMQEEIGLKPLWIKNYWTMKTSGTVNNLQYFFVARDLVPSKLPNPDGDDCILSIKAYSPEELMAIYESDKIRWSMSTLGFFRLLHWLKAEKQA